MLSFIGDQVGMGTRDGGSLISVRLKLNDRDRS